MAVALGLAGCATNSTVVGPATKFATAEAGATGAERGYLDQVSASFAQASDTVLLDKYLNNPKSIQAANLATPAPAIPPATRQSIERVLGALDVYGKSLAAMAGDTSYGDLSANAKNLSTQLAALNATPLVNNRVALGDTNAIIAAGNAIATLLLDRKRYQDIRAAAVASQQPIDDIVTALKQINTSYTVVIGENRTTMQNGILSITHDAPRDRTLYQELVTEYRALETAQTDVGKLNDALDGLAKANSAIATAKREDTDAAIADFIQRAETAYAFYKSLPTK